MIELHWIISNDILCTLINLCGINSTHTVHQGLLCCFTLCIAFWGILSRHSLSFYEELTVGFVSGGATAHGPNVLWSTPPIQESTIKTAPMESPSMLETVHVWQIKDVSSRVPLCCTFPKSVIQAYHKVQKSVETVPYIKDTRHGVILLKCEIPVPPWELVPHCTCTSPKWSRLVLTSLRITTHCTWCSQSSQFQGGWFVLFWGWLRQAFWLIFSWPVSW